MIRLTRYAARTPVVLNLATIAYIDGSPDTYVTLLSGERVHVRESQDEVVALALAWQRRVLTSPIEGRVEGQES